MEQNADIVIIGITRIESDERFIWKPNKYYDNDKPNFPQNGHHHLKLVDNELHPSNLSLNS